MTRSSSVAISAKPIRSTIAATTDIRLLHQSEGDFGGTWQRYAERFVARHPGLGKSPAGAPHWYGVLFDGRDAAAAYFDRLDASIAALDGAP